MTTYTKTAPGLHKNPIEALKLRRAGLRTRAFFQYNLEQPSGRGQARKAVIASNLDPVSTSASTSINNFSLRLVQMQTKRVLIQALKTVEMTTIWALLPRGGSAQLHPRFPPVENREACESPHLFEIKCDLAAAQRKRHPCPTQLCLVEIRQNVMRNLEGSSVTGQGGRLPAAARLFTRGSAPLLPW